MDNGLNLFALQGRRQDDKLRSGTDMLLEILTAREAPMHSNTSSTHNCLQGRSDGSEAKLSVATWTGHHQVASI